MTTETQTNAAEVQPKNQPNRLRIIGNGTMGGTRIEDTTTGDMIRFVQSYTVTQRKGELAHAVIEVVLPEIDLECDATIVETTGVNAPDERPKPATAAPTIVETGQNKQPSHLLTLDDVLKAVSPEQIAAIFCKRQDALSPRFAPGDRVAKVGGSYQATGVIKAAWLADDGTARYVFRFDNPAGMLHIFSDANLEVVA